jgi:hypothetical protein
MILPHTYRCTLIAASALLCFLFSSSAIAQENKTESPIKNATWSIDTEGDFVVITYDLDQPPKGEVEISIVLRRTSKPSLKIKPKNLVGHVGDKVEPGKKRKIFWQYKKDNIQGLAAEGWYFDILADWNGDDYTAFTRVGTFTPPALHIESLKFWGSEGGPKLEAGEQGEVTFIVSNSGRGGARGVKVTMTPVREITGLEYDQEDMVGEILPRGAMRGKLRILAREDVPAQTATFRIDAVDSARYDSTSVLLEFTTKPLLPPHLVIGDKYYRTRKERRILNTDAFAYRGDTVQVFLKVMNTGQGEAESAFVHIQLRDEGPQLFMVSPRKVFLVKSFRADPAAGSPKGLLPGEGTPIEFSFVVGQGYTGENACVDVRMTERRPQFSSSDTLTFRVTARPPTYRERAESFLKMGAYDSLLATGLREIATTPDSAAPYYFTAVAYEQKKDVRAASNYYQKAADRGHPVAQQWVKGTRVREVLKVSYRPLAPNPFSQFSGSTIGIGVLAGGGSGGGEGNLGTLLYDQLKSVPEVTRKFGLYSADALKKALKVPEVSAEDHKVLKSLESLLAVKFVVICHGPDDRAFTVRVIRTSDGAVTLEREVKNTDTSTAMSDAVQMFQSGKMPVYRLEPVLEPRRGH